MTPRFQRHIVRESRCVLVVDLPRKQVCGILVEEEEDLGHSLTESISG